MKYQLVGIHGAPRSGTSWLGQIFNSHELVAYRYQPFFSYAFRGRIDARSEPNDMRRLFDDLFVTQDAFVTQSGGARLAREALDFTKTSPTHLVYKEVRFHELMEHILVMLPESRMIGIVRDPLQVIESWMAAPREFNREWSIVAEWRAAQKKNARLPENWYGFERWKVLARLFLRLKQLYPNRFTIIRYAELVQNTVASVERIFDFAGLSPSRQTAQFLNDSTSRDDGDPYGVHRKRKPATDSHLPEEIRVAVERDLTNSDLAQFMIRRP